MLPCQSDCPAYKNGCHKTCAHWQAFQAQQQVQREAKKEYLKFHTEQCLSVARQLRALAVRRPMW